jgi:hypothetical protein
MRQLVLLISLPVFAQSARFTAQDAIQAEWVRQPIAWTVQQRAALPAPDRARLDRTLARIGTPRCAQRLAEVQAGNPDSGKPEKTKQLDRVVPAVQHLQRRRPTRLLVAGFNAGTFMAREGPSRPEGIDVLDNPSDSELMEAMRSVDVAIQLRFPSKGESTGVVGHLLGMGGPPWWPPMRAASPSSGRQRSWCPPMSPRRPWPMPFSRPTRTHHCAPPLPHTGWPTCPRLSWQPSTASWLLTRARFRADRLVHGGV